MHEVVRKHCMDYLVRAGGALGGGGGGTGRALGGHWEHRQGTGLLVPPRSSGLPQYLGVSSASRGVPAVPSVGGVPDVPSIFVPPQRPSCITEV